MIKIQFVFCSIVLVVFFVACSEKVEEGDDTGSIMEYSTNDEQEKEEPALAEELPIVQDFFSLSTDILSEEFCYDREALLDVIVEGEELEETWHKYFINASEDYLAMDNEECFAQIEFKIFENQSGKHAYLLRTNKSFQDFMLLDYDDESKEWLFNEGDLPQPNMRDFFGDLSEEEEAMVNEYGFYYAYMEAEGDSIYYVFSEWEMGLRMGEKEVKEFTPPVKYEFILYQSEKGSELMKKNILEDEILEGDASNLTEN